MADSSQLGTVDATAGLELTYGKTPAFGNSVPVTSYSLLEISQAASRQLFPGNFTPSPQPHILFRQNTGVTLVPALGVISRLLLEAVTFDITDDIVAGDRSIVRYLRRQSPGSFPTNGNTMNAIQRIGEYTGTATGGTWDLIFTMQDGSLVTVTNAFNDDLGDIQDNVDTVMAGEILGYVAGDVEITGVIGITNDVEVNFTGDSVKHTHWEPVQTDVTNLVGDGDFGPVTNTQYGHPARYGWSVLYILGVVGTTPTAKMGMLPNSFNVSAPGSRADYPPQWVVRALAEEMAYVEDNAALKTQLFKELGIR